MRIGMIHYLLLSWPNFNCASTPEGIEAKTEFTHRLTSVEVAIHNQDDREHDIFDR